MTFIQTLGTAISYAVQFLLLDRLRIGTGKFVGSEPLRFDLQVPPDSGLYLSFVDPHS